MKSHLLSDGKSEEKKAGDVSPELQEIILKGLEGRIATPRTRVGYQFGLLLVAFANLMLPLVYFGLIFLVGHAMYWHVRYNTLEILAAGSKARAAVVLVLLPPVMGALTLIFLIKPLFARDPQEGRPLVLKRKAEPFLFEYVTAICRAVGAPVPHSIILMCEPNASASFAGGLWGLLTGRMCLRIGLPLVSGMSLRQLTGVLAHEFGHFSQRGGMRVSLIVRLLNAWMVKIVFLRDGWDDRLEGWTRRGDSYLWVFGRISQFCIWLSRQMMFGLLWISNSVSCYFMRQMEFDADRFEARLVGMRVMKTSFRQLSELGVAHALAVRDLQLFHTEGRLADDFPALIVSNISKITPEIRKKIRAIEQEQETGLFDTHPTDRERLESLEEEPDVGVFQLPKGIKEPGATVLFTNFEIICRRMTTEYYEEVLGKSFKKSMVRPVADLIAYREAEIAAGKTLDRYFQIHVPVDRSLPLFEDADRVPKSGREAVGMLRSAREEMLAELEKYRELPKRYESAQNVLYEAVESLSVIESGVTLTRAEARRHGLSEEEQEKFEEKMERARSAVQAIATQMLAFETASSTRLSTALQLLQVQKVTEAIKNGEALKRETTLLIPYARLVSGIVSGMPAMVILYRRMVGLLAKLGKNPPRSIMETLLKQMEVLWIRLNEIGEELKGRPYPFEHGDETVDLQTYVLPVIPAFNDLFGLVQASELMGQRLFILQVRLFSRLAQVAEKVEMVFGMDPLPELPPEKNESSSH